MTRAEQLIRRGIFFTAVSLTVILICGGRKPNLRSETYIISHGDTLWSIASEYKPNEMRYDEYIQLLQKENGIGSNIQPGQEILIFTEE